MLYSRKELLLHFRLKSVRVLSIDPKICDFFEKQEGSAAKEFSGERRFRLSMEFSYLISAQKFLPSFSEIMSTMCNIQEDTNLQQIRFRLKFRENFKF
jgi:hypothetical protein